MVMKPEIAARQKRLDARMRQRAIGRELRRRYSGAAEEPIPADMAELVSRIEKQKKPHSQH
jgi:hypothetical protein